ncbi:MAG: hypothetical protein KI785_10715 [Devosiaceae bacterium]|nr:hypothetical protein [Devosiaceae bacterium MH13]
MSKSFNHFQSEHEGQNSPRKLRRFGFMGRVLDGAGLVALGLTLAIIAFTSGARAQEPMAAATADHNAVLMTAMLAMFAMMVMIVRQTWRKTTKRIETTNTRSHRVG